MSTTLFRFKQTLDVRTFSDQEYGQNDSLSFSGDFEKTIDKDENVLLFARYNLCANPKRPSRNQTNLDEIKMLRLKTLSFVYYYLWSHTEISEILDVVD